MALMLSDGPSGADGMARLCIEYETEMEASQRRPVNLLDALEHSDQRNGEEEDALVGEERVCMVLSTPPCSGL